MAQPTLTEIFGTPSTIDGNLNALVIPSSFFAQYGINLNSALPIELLAVLIVTTYFSMATNTDETVNLAVTRTITAPVSRNNQDKTSFSFNLEFFGSYESPTFQINDL
jgi:hypothetical protein